MASSSSDQEYMAFLDKANKDLSQGTAAAAAAAQGGGGGGGGGGAKPFRTTQAGVDVPAPLAHACRDAFYTSDADEPFEAFALAWDERGRGLPDEGSFLFFFSFSFPSFFSLFPPLSLFAVANVVVMMMMVVRRGVCGAD